MPNFKQIATTVTVAAILTLGLASCSSSTSSTAEKPAVTKTSGSDLAASSVKASDVLAAFKSAGLPTANDRDNTKNQCEPDGAYTCSAWITTDDISIGKFTTSKQFKTLKSFGTAYIKDDIVLSYGAARTPEADQPKYEAVLDKLLAAS